MAGIEFLSTRYSSPHPVPGTVRPSGEGGAEEEAARGAEVKVKVEVVRAEEGAARGAEVKAKVEVARAEEGAARGAEVKAKVEVARVKVEAVKAVAAMEMWGVRPAGLVEAGEEERVRVGVLAWAAMVEGKERAARAAVGTVEARVATRARAAVVKAWAAVVTARVAARMGKAMVPAVWVAAVRVAVAVMEMEAGVVMQVPMRPRSPALKAQRS